jgi:hypothetical protein
VKNVVLRCLLSGVQDVHDQYQWPCLPPQDEEPFISITTICQQKSRSVLLLNQNVRLDFWGRKPTVGGNIDF